MQLFLLFLECWNLDNRKYSYIFGWYILNSDISTFLLYHLPNALISSYEAVIRITQHDITSTRDDELVGFHPSTLTSHPSGVCAAIFTVHIL